MQERERMLAGELYDASAAELVAARARARELTRRYNDLPGTDQAGRDQVLRELLGRLGADVWIEPPFYCDYGTNIELGDGAYLNFGCVFLDCARITVGDRSLLGPAVQVYAATHPTDPAVRASGLELARPVRIGRDTWIGGGAIIGPGVTIGDGTTIGAGAVVVADVPAGVIAAGNPCRVLRRVAE